MKKRIALLAVVGAVLVFTLALVALSVYTVNATAALTTSTATLDRPATMNVSVSTDTQIMTDAASDTTDAVEVSVQHVGRQCDGADVGDNAY